jgi:hypothetical protein
MKEAFKRFESEHGKLHPRLTCMKRNSLSADKKTTNKPKIKKTNKQKKFKGKKDKFIHK